MPEIRRFFVMDMSLKYLKTGQRRVRISSSPPKESLGIVMIPRLFLIFVLCFCFKSLVLDFLLLCFPFSFPFRDQKSVFSGFLGGMTDWM